MLASLDRRVAGVIKRAGQVASGALTVPSCARGTNVARRLISSAPQPGEACFDAFISAYSGVKTGSGCPKTNSDPAARSAAAVAVPFVRSAVEPARGDSHAERQ